MAAARSDAGAVVGRSTQNRLRFHPAGAGLLLETAQAILIMGERGFEHLEGNVPPQPLVAGAVHFPHPPQAYLFQNPIVTQNLTNHANPKRRLSAC